MVPFHIRQYRPSDLGAVQQMYVVGVWEHFPRARRHVLWQPCVQTVLVLAFGLSLLLSGSLLWPLALTALLLAAGHLLLRHLWSSIVEQNLRDDLLDVGRSYLQPEDACFWVAECGGVVVGTVGVSPSPLCAGELRLRRMNVALGYRGWGIAKALSRTALQFAQSRGYRGVTLGTSVIQTEAQCLYRRLGFSHVGTVLPPNPLAKLTNYTIHQYHYRVDQQGRQQPWTTDPTPSP